MPSPERLDERVRPRGAQLVVLVATALAAGAAGAWMTRAVAATPSPGWAPSLAVGAAIAAAIIALAMRGSRVTVSADGVLTYHLHGRANLSIDLTQVVAIRPVADGIGLELADVRQVRFLHRGGISPERMRRWRQAFGVDLVLEGFGAGLGERLEALRRGVSG